MKFTKLVGREQSGIWNVNLDDGAWVGQISPVVPTEVTGPFSFRSGSAGSRSREPTADQLEEIALFMRCLENPKMAGVKPKKPLRIPRKELALIVSMADEMANCTDYMVRDEEGEPAGRDPKVDRALDKVRKTFGLKG